MLNSNDHENQSVDNNFDDSTEDDLLINLDNIIVRDIDMDQRLKGDRIDKIGRMDQQLSKKDR